MTPSYDGTQLPSFQAVPVPQHPSPSQSSLGACVLVGQGAGDDQVFVGAGDDQVFVGAGDDQVFVGAAVVLVSGVDEQLAQHISLNHPAGLPAGSVVQ